MSPLTAWRERRPRMFAAGVLAAAAAALMLLLGGLASRGEGGEVPTCAGSEATSLACQQRRHAAIVERSGVGTAFAALKAGYRRHPFLRNACHPITHSIGHAAADRYQKLADAYARGDSFCSAGYFHGVTERLVQKGGRVKLTAQANELCADLGGHRRHAIYHRNCAHGLGHGFMLVHGYQLPKSLGACDELDDDWERRSCYGGVFMENVMTVGLGSSKTKYLRRRDPLYPCHALARRYREMCYQKQTGYALFVRGDSFTSVFDLCGRVQKAFRPACHQGLGTNIAVHYLKRISRDEQRTGLTAGVCMSTRDRNVRRNCLKGAVRAVINYDHGVRRAKDICAAVQPAMRADCLQVLEDKKSWPE